jgi:hypothetical protein
MEPTTFAEESGPSTTIVGKLLSRFKTMTPEELQSLDAMPTKRFVLPEASVDVMRVRLVEEYTVDGVGTDTVELSGWIAVRHGKPRKRPGTKELSWNTAIIDTEFLGMDLRGYSEVFGPVFVQLDPQLRSLGHVGSIEDDACYMGALWGGK